VYRFQLSRELDNRVLGLCDCATRSGNVQSRATSHHDRHHRTLNPRADREGMTHTSEAIVPTHDETDRFCTATFKIAAHDGRDFKVSGRARIPVIERRFECVGGQCAQ
jgi:hypothetical protein